MGRSVNFQDELTKRTDEIEKGIREFLPKEEGFAKSMAQAMNYSMLAGGKRLRPLLMQETYRLFGGKEKVIRPFMTGMEMIHTHSLIHDDLPALDNDDYRRGRLTTHKVYGEAMGILSGVALLNYAYETMLLAFERTAYPERVIRGLSVMAEKTGIHGMLGGQSVDVENDGTPLTKEMLDYIYRNKTSALIEAAMMTGAILAGADENSVAIIEEAAGKIGLAFQIQDDILDVTSTEEELGKPVHSDEKNNKVTYVTLFGIEEASRQVKELSEDAVSLLKGLNKNNEFLYLLVEKLINRRK
nr:farnesyl diphosphate synthase [Blautia luti]